MRMPCHSLNGAGMSLQALQQRARTCLPDQDSAVVTPTRQSGSILVPRQAVHHSRVLGADPPALTGAQVPDPHRLIIAPARKELSIRTPGDTRDHVGMS